MDNKQIKYGALFSYIALVSGSIVSLLLTPFIIRNIGPIEYGLYTLMGSLVAYATLLDCGVGNAIVRYIASCRTNGDRDQESELVSLFLIINVILAFIALLVGMLVYSNLDQLFGSSLTIEELKIARVIFLILVFNYSVAYPLTTFQSIINGYENFIYTKSINIIKLLIRTFLVIGVLLFGFKAIALVIVDTVVSLIIGISNLYYAKFCLHIPIVLRRFNWMLFTEISRYSFFVFICMIADVINWRVGQIFVGMYHGPLHAGVFSISLSLITFFMTIALAVNGLFVPKITRMVLSNESLDIIFDLFVRVSRIQWILVAYVFGGFLLYGREFLLLWLGYSFKEAWLPAVIIMVPLSIDLVQTVGTQILYAKNMHRFRGLALLFSAVVNIIVCVFLVEPLGLIGAALATSMSYLIGNVLLVNGYYHFRVGFNMVDYFSKVFKNTLPAFFAALSVGLFTYRLAEVTWLIFLIKCTIYSIAFALGMWVKGLNENEKIYIRKTLVWFHTKLKCSFLFTSLK